MLLAGCEPEKDPCLSAYESSSSSPSPSPSQPLVKSPVMIILDASGSMKKKYPNPKSGTPRIKNAKQTIETIINSTQATNLDISLTVLGHRKEGCLDNVEVVPEKNKNILPILNNIDTVGNTPLTEAIDKASQKFINKDTSKTIVVLTDGVETCRKTLQGKDDRQAPYDKVNKLKKDGFKFVLNVIGVSTTLEDDKILAELAKIGGGKYYKPENSSQLLDSMNESVFGFGKLEVQKTSLEEKLVKGWKLYEKGNSTPIKNEIRSKETDQNLWRKNEVLSGNYGFCLYFDDSKNSPIIRDIKIEKHKLTKIDKDYKVTIEEQQNN